MKKAFSLLLCFFVLLFAIGCAPNPNGSKWIKQIKKENILSVDIQINSCGDFAFIQNKTSDSLADIELVYDWLQKIELIEDENNGYGVDACGNKVLTIYTKHGTYSLSQFAMNGLKAGDKFYQEVYPLPNLGVETVYHFEALLSDNALFIDGEPTTIIDEDFEKYRFVKTEEIFESPKEYKFLILGEYELTVYGERSFSFAGQNFAVVGNKTFKHIFEKYPI